MPRDLLLDGAENRFAGAVLHLDPDRVAEAHERCLWRTGHDGFDGAKFRDARIADAALGDRLARPALLVLVGYRPRTDDRSGPERAGLRRMGDEGSEIE